MLNNQLEDKFPFLNDISDSARTLLYEKMKNITIGPNQHVIHKGDVVSGAYLVRGGHLRVYTMDDKGNETTLYSVGAGQSCLLALNCVFSDMRYPAWVATEELNTDVVLIPSTVFKKLYQTENSVRDFSFNVLSDRLFGLMNVLEEMTTQDLDYRLASFLARRADGNSCIRQSHQTIALQLGTVREVISRKLKKLEHEGIIEMHRGYLIITSFDKLLSRK